MSLGRNYYSKNAHDSNAPNVLCNSTKNNGTFYNPPPLHLKINLYKVNCSESKDRLLSCYHLRFLQPSSI